MDKVLIIGLIIHLILELGKTTTLKVKENIHGQMEGNIKEAGLIINFKDTVFILGQMVENMKASTIKIKNTDKELIHGQLENNILEDGKMVNNMEKQHLLMKKERAKEEFGMKEKEKNG